MTRNRCVSWLLLALAVSAATPALADSYLIFSEAGIPGNGADVWVWCEGGACDFAEVQLCDTPEGSHHFRQQGQVAWEGWGVFLNIDATNNPQPEDLSAYAGGDLRFFVQSPFDLKVEFQCKPSGSVVTRSRRISQHGWTATNTWQEIVIPLASFFSPQPVDLSCLGTVISPFMATADNMSNININRFRVDYVRWHRAHSHSGATSVQAQGRKLLVDGDPFVVNGFAYAPISICEDYHGAFSGDRSDRYSVDFPLMAGTGANTVRIYSTFMTKAMLDAARSEGLYVIPTFQVDPVQLTCANGRTHMKNRFVEVVQEWKDHPAILAWLIGNEVNEGLSPTDLCNTWYPQLDSMALAAHQAEGASFHPVGTANHDSPGLDDICSPGCSGDTSLPNLDFWGVQVYRGCSFGSTFNTYRSLTDCARPLIVTEFGADAWDSGLGVEDQTMQADCLEALLEEADQALAVRGPLGVSSGQILFEWADEWWKAFPPDPPVPGFCTATNWCDHDGCVNWENPAYDDRGMNEEWWGIVGLDAANPTSRVPRAASGRVSGSWNLGPVCNLKIVSHNRVSGNATISFDPAAGSTDHTLYYGPLSAVSTYGYSGSVSGLGATGSSSVTLPSGSLFWVVAGRNNAAEGCYGTNFPAGIERPPFGAASVPQAANRTCQCP